MNNMFLEAINESIKLWLWYILQEIAETEVRNKSSNISLPKIVLPILMLLLNRRNKSNRIIVANSTIFPSPDNWYGIKHKSLVDTNIVIINKIFDKPINYICKRPKVGIALLRRAFRDAHQQLEWLNFNVYWLSAALENPSKLGILLIGTIIVIY